MVEGTLDCHRAVYNTSCTRCQLQLATFHISTTILPGTQPTLRNNLVTATLLLLCALRLPHTSERTLPPLSLTLSPPNK